MFFIWLIVSGKNDPGTPKEDSPQGEWALIINENDV